MSGIYLTVAQIEALAALARGDGSIEYGLNEQPVVHGIEIDGDAFATTQINAKAVINGRLDAVAHTIVLENGTTNGWEI
jgi:hypothetical protein